MRSILAALIVVVALGLASAAAFAARWPVAEERAFLVNCNATSGGRIAACRCELRWLEKRYTTHQIAAIYLHDQPRMIRILIRAARACR